MAKEELPYYIKKEGESDQEHWKRMQPHIRAEKANRQRQIDEGYTYYDQLMEFHSNPENRTDLALKIDKMVDKVKGGFNNLGEKLASKLIGQDPVTGEIPKQKAHDSINDLINQTDNAYIMDLVMGVSGGGGANIGKAGKNIISKILARNAKTRRNLRPGAPTQGWQTLDPSNLPRGVRPGPPALTAVRRKPSGGSVEKGLIGGGAGYLLAQMIRGLSEEAEGEYPNIGLPPKQY